MPSGAKKRKALKKKQQQQQQEAIGTSANNNKGFNGDNNLHGGNDEQRSQDDRESDSSLSSPGSQGNEEFGVTKDQSAAISSSLVVKDTAKEIPDVTQCLGPKSGNDVAVERGTDDKNNKILEKSPISSNGNSCGDSVEGIAPVVGSVSNVVISEKSEHAETSTHSNLVKQKSDEKKESQSLVKENGKVDTLAGSANGTSRKVESERESEAPLSSEEKRVLLHGPPAVRTSWLSCCGLFDAVTGSDR